MRPFLFFVLLIFGACSVKKEVSDSPAEFLPGKRLKELTNSRLSELSGLAASNKNRGYLWSFNDSGNGAEVFLLDEALNIKLTCKLVGIENRDWEDITVGPGPDAKKTYVYIGEIGDNKAVYPLKYIYRFEEPDAKSSPEEISINQFDTLTFRLAGKLKDTESLLINPLTKNLYVVSKREEPVVVYELKYPHSTRDTLTADSIASLPITQIVAGDFSADGKEILLKSYDNIYYWNNKSGKPVEKVFLNKPVEIPYEVEPQGESITWALDGSGFYTISEMNKKKKSFLYFYQRK